MNIRRLVLCLCLLLLIGSVAGNRANAQAITGSLSGLVADSSKAVVPNATVLLKNEQSGDARRTITNSEGFFTIAAVPAGAYTVIIEASGFKKWEQQGVVFNAGDKRTLADVVLEVGAASESVTVSAAVETVAPVDSGEKSQTITAKQIQNISVIGRSAAELIKILPGMTPTGTGLTNTPGFTGEAIGINGNGDKGHQSALGYYVANGTRTESMDIVADGAHVSDPGCNCATPVNPNVDMVQEFKVLQGNYGAEHAKGPVVLNAVAKAGGRDFHGTGYYYMRDYRLNANEWRLNKAKQERSADKYRFPGFNLGGPVLIPGTNFNRNRDKLFFFAGYEYYQQTLDTGVLSAAVPTNAMKQGDFTNPPAGLGFDGDKMPSATGIVNGRIDAAAIDKGGQALLGLLPAPNVDPKSNGGINYIKALTLDQPMHQFLTRIDYSISDNTKLFVRYNLQRETQNFPVGLWWRNGGQVPYPTPVTAKNRSDSISTSLTHVFSPTLTNETIFGLTYIDFPNALDDPKKVSRSALGYTHPGIFKNGLDQIPSFTGWSNIGTVYNPGGFDPVLFARKWLVSGADNLSKVHGTHTMKFGAYWEIVTNNQPGNGDSNGTIAYASWGGNTTGNPFADLLMGRAAQYQETTKNVLHNIGFRTTEFYAQDSWKASRRLTVEYGARFAHLGAWYDRQGIGLGVFDRSKYSNNPADLSKLTGLTWNKANSSVPLSGAQTKSLFISPRLGAAYDLFGTGRTVLRGGFGMYRYHDPQGPFPSALDQAAGYRSTSVGDAHTLGQLDQIVPSAAKIAITTMDPNDDQQPLTYNWNVTISQRLPKSNMWEIAYVGTKSTNLLNDGFQNTNLVPIGAMLDGKSTSPDNYRPLQNYQAVNIIRHTAYQNYHALQTTLNRQAGRLTYQFAYTFSKNLGIRGGGQGSVSNQFNLRDNYGVVAYDRTHVFNVAYVLQLPEFTKMMGTTSRAAAAIVNGWQFSGITQLGSGLNLQANAGSNLGLPVPGGSQTITGTPDLPAQPILKCDPGKNLATDQFINPSCFAFPTVGRNGPFIFPYIKGPGYMNHDLSVFKDWKFSESRKLQFRFSAYNFLNHPLLSFDGNGDGNLNLSSYFNTDGTVKPGSRFGYAETKVGRRIVQLAIKFYF